MKKIVCCAALALLLALCAVAVAEYDDYTHEIVRGDFHIFLPEEFNIEDEQFKIGFSTESESTYPYIRITLEDGNEHYGPYYENSGECIEALTRFADFGESLGVIYDKKRFIRVDECAGIVLEREQNDFYETLLAVTNRDKLLGIDIEAQTEQLADLLFDGILSHIVAPEMP